MIVEDKIHPVSEETKSALEDAYPNEPVPSRGRASCQDHAACTVGHQGCCMGAGLMGGIAGILLAAVASWLFVLRKQQRDCFKEVGIKKKREIQLY